MLQADQDKRISMFLAFILRHDPSAANVSMDEHGWVDVNELIGGMNDTGKDITHEYLEYLVETDNKQRYSFSDDGLLIRANQGHSIPVDLELIPVEPPEFLYHGTATRFLSSIERDGILPMKRLHVHLSPNEETASLVGERHGKLAILKIYAREMYEDGYDFFLSSNGVWLTEIVEPEYFKQIL